MTAATLRHLTTTDIALHAAPLAAELYHEARAAIAAGAAVEYHAGRLVGAGGVLTDIGVETIVIDGERAGQVVNGNAVWGEWNAETQTLRTDDDVIVALDGTERPA